MRASGGGQGDGGREARPKPAALRRGTSAEPRPCACSLPTPPLQSPIFLEKLYESLLFNAASVVPVDVYDKMVAAGSFDKARGVLQSVRESAAA